MGDSHLDFLTSYATFHTQYPKMIFRSPSWVPQIDKGIPDTVLVGDFVTQRNHNLYDWSDDKATLICAISNKTYDMKTIKQRISRLSRSLSKELDWSSNAGSPWNKVIGIFSYNTVCSITDNSYPKAKYFILIVNFQIDRFLNHMLGCSSTGRNLSAFTLNEHRTGD